MVGTIDPEMELELRRQRSALLVRGMFFSTKYRTHFFICLDTSVGRWVVVELNDENCGLIMSGQNGRYQHADLSFEDLEGLEVLSVSVPEEHRGFSQAMI